MTLPIVFAIAGCIAILVGLFGGGIKVKEIDIPQISTLPRFFSILIGLALITSATWLSSPSLFQPASTATPQPMTEEPPTVTLIPPITDTLTLTPTVEVIASSTPLSPTNSPEFTPTIPSGLEPGMRVIITASRTSGKAPLNINFNAGDSYLLMNDGKILKCGACSFTWSIRFGSNFIFGPEKKDATFEYKFGKKGTYFVILKVCRNGVDETCGTSGVNIVVN